MLKCYRTDAGYIRANEESAIVSMVEKKKRYNAAELNARLATQHVEKCEARTYRTSAPMKQQSAIGRVRAAVSRMYPNYDHATIGAIARRILKQARFTRIDCDNDKTHLAFSPDGVSAHDKKRRRGLTFAKYLRRKCGDLLRNRLALTDAMIDAGTSGFAKQTALGVALKIVNGQDALDVYAETNSEGTKGISSCMSRPRNGRENCARHTSEYVASQFLDNTDNVSLVVAYSEDRLALRAKLFKNDDGTMFLDRIYSRRCELIPAGIYEGHLRVEILAWLNRQGMEVSKRYDFTLNHDAGLFMPYMDHADHFDREDDSTVRFYELGDYVAESTDGSDSSLTTCRCCACNSSIDEDDCRHNDDGETYCDNCFAERYDYDEVSNREIDADDAVQTYQYWRGQRRTVTTHQDNCYETYDGEYVICEDAIELHDGRYALPDDEDVTCTESGESALLGDVTFLHDGTTVLTDDGVVELHNGEWALEDDCVQLHSGEYHLEDDEDVVFLAGDAEIYALRDDCTEVTDDYGDLVYVFTDDHVNVD